MPKTDLVKLQGLSKRLKMVNPVLLLRGEDSRENSEEAGSPEDARGHHEVRPVIVPRVHLEGMLIVQIFPSDRYYPPP